MHGRVVLSALPDEQPQPTELALFDTHGAHAERASPRWRVNPCFCRART
jgi:hypothetical protein